ncbi:MAG TPA: family 10 glycosylhydrolase [Chitinophagaceae bacterium]|nr:family 10 glycosylhydrolase [Chitinophagaceae bacterium]
MIKYLYSASLFICFNLLCPALFAQPKYEFRGVWVATVDNIDFPSAKFLNSESQKAEFINLLDMNKRNGMNAMVVQIRPAADAFYASPYEPWSEWLTGVQGKPPSPYYDPLQFMITETHKRGMEFHAWMNPYRAVFNINKSSIAPDHITKLHPDWFINYGTVKYFDPGNKDVQRYVTSIVKDVVSRYDIDAIHFDDYFYPYRIAGKEFYDTASYRKYGNGMDKETWRRSNVDSIIWMLGHAIKRVKPYCKFGISPFGVWRNIGQDADGSDTKAGQTNYDDLYADILLWLRKGWIDYVAPQLYWEIGNKIVGYEVLVDWWARHTYGRQLYIGHGIYKTTETRSHAWRNREELPNQIKLLRKYPQVQGSIYFSSSSFSGNPNGWNDSLRNNYYKYPAIVPPMNWIDSVKPPPPVISLDTSKVMIYDHFIDFYIRQDPVDSLVNRYVIYNFSDTSSINYSDPKNIFSIVESGENYYHFNLDDLSQQKKIVIAITSLTRTNNESLAGSYIYLERKANGWHLVNHGRK